MTPNHSRWPARLWIVRHGQSAGNIAHEVAHATGAERLELDGRDVDVPLSALGEEQADALGRWFAEGRGNGCPDVILASPYMRAQQTIARARQLVLHQGQKEEQA